MDRNFFYKVALLLLAFSLVPLVIFLSRKENPPEKVAVKVHKKQTVENFTLTSLGKRRWILTAPVAVFEGPQLVRLQNPVLRAEGSPPVEIRAKEALLDRSRGVVRLKEVLFKSADLSSCSPEGTYYLQKELFLTEKGCTFYFGESETEGRRCSILPAEGKVIITDSVKTLFRGALK